MTIKAVIFDLGGVLVRTEDRGPRTQLAGRVGMTYEQLEDLVFGSDTARLATLGKLPVEKHWESVCAALNLPFEKVAEVQAGFWGGDHLDMELVNYIRSLRPRFQTALLSNAFRDLRQYMEHQWRILDAFDQVFISAEIGVAKPDPHIYRMVVEKLKVSPSEAVFVDDFEENIAGARAEGLHAIRFKSTAHVKTELDRLLSEDERA